MADSPENSPANSPANKSRAKKAPAKKAPAKKSNVTAAPGAKKAPAAKTPPRALRGGETVTQARRMGGWDFATWRMATDDPVMRSTILGVMVLDQNPDWDRLCDRYERASRLAQKRTTSSSSPRPPSRAAAPTPGSRSRASRPCSGTWPGPSS